MFKMILVDTQADLCSKFEKHFSGMDQVSVINARFQDVQEWDCVVTPANSYGIMDGGFDYYLAEYFGPELQRSVRSGLYVHYSGVQPVGTSMIVETGNEKHPFVAHTPTMRYPMSIQGTINVFLAMKAAMEAVQDHNDNVRGEIIDTVLCPGIGTCAGGMDSNAAAYQMRLAYDMVFNPPKRMTWDVVREIEGRFHGGL